MKATGIVRRVDELGRIGIPKELRRTMNIETGDPLEIFTTNNTIALRKYTPCCKLCNRVSDVITIDEISICKPCAQKLSRNYL